MAGSGERWRVPAQSWCINLAAREKRKKTMSGFGSLASSPLAARPVFSNSDVLLSRQLRLRTTTLPQSLFSRQWKQAPLWKSSPIMQTDTGMLFKNPQPICWSLLIYKGLRAESPVKTILDTVYTSFFCLWKKVPLRLPQTITFYCT